MEDPIKKIETLKELLRHEIVFGGTTTHNMYGLSPREEKQIRKRLLTLIKLL
jgi:hypothetical protein